MALLGTRFRRRVRRERVWVAHLLRDGLRVSRCVVYPARGSAACVPAFASERMPDLHAAFRAVAQAIGRFSFRARPFLLFVLDPGLATSVYGSVTVPRDRPAAPITGADVENSIAQGMWKLFDRERSRAARKMEVSELDLVLSDVRVRDLRLDGHRVFDPEGFTARSIGVECMGTFLPRPLLDAFHAVFSKERSAFFGEGGVLMARMLAAGAADRPSLLIQAFGSVSDVFLATRTSCAYDHTVPWGTQDVARAVAEAFTVSGAVARAMLVRAAHDALSPHVLRRLEQALALACEPLVSSIAGTVERHGVESVRLAPFAGFFGAHESVTQSVPLPDSIFRIRFRTRTGTRVQFEQAQAVSPHGDTPPQGRAAEQQGSLWDLAAHAAFSHFFFSPADDTLNRAARRRARWLTSAVPSDVGARSTL